MPGKEYDPWSSALHLKFRGDETRRILAILKHLVGPDVEMGSGLLEPTSSPMRDGAMVQKWKTLGFGAGAATVAGLLMAFAPAAANASTITSVVARTVAHASLEQTAQAGDFELCSEGGYDSYASFPDRGGLATYVVPNGSCYVTYLGGDTNEQVNIYEANNNHYIGSTIYNGSVGETIVTIAGPSFYAYNG